VITRPDPARPPVALTIAGSDSSGGAGIQADLKTFTALGVYGASAVTALTAQNTEGVSGVWSPGVDVVRAQIRAVFDDLTIGAVKTGMLGDVATVTAVADELIGLDGVPVVVDPVMVATSGDRLLAPDAIDSVRVRMVPLADVLTPNLPEAAVLLECGEARDEAEARRQVRALHALGARAVLLKGGHGAGAASVDLFFDGREVVTLAHPRIDTLNTHGTGCTLSAAIAAFLAAGLPVREAVTRAKSFVWQAIAAARGQRLGKGHGPVDHLFAIKGNPRPA